MVKFFVILDNHLNKASGLFQKKDSAINLSMEMAKKNPHESFFVVECLGRSKSKGAIYEGANSVEDPLKEYRDPPIHGSFNCKGDYIFPKEWIRTDNSNDSGLEQGLRDTVNFQKGGVFNEKA